MWRQQKQSMTDGQTLDKVITMWRFASLAPKIVAAFRGMHVSPAKHSFGKCDRRTDRRTDRQTDRQTDDGQSDPYVSLCFAGDTKIPLSMISIVTITCKFPNLLTNSIP